MSTYCKAHDPLYDMEVSVEQQLYFKVKAAISMVIDTGRPMERIFRMYVISTEEWMHFADTYPQDVEKLIRACGA